MSLEELANEGLLVGDSDGISMTTFAVFVAGVKLGLRWDSTVAHISSANAPAPLRHHHNPHPHSTTTALPSLEKNVVSAVGEAGTQASDQLVKVGWVLRSIAGTDVGTEKTAIMKAAAAALKAKGAEGARFGFQTPLDAAAHAHCVACDKFVEVSAFEGASADLAAGPGKRTCLPCEEYAAEFGGGEYD